MKFHEVMLFCPFWKVLRKCFSTNFPSFSQLPNEIGTWHFRCSWVAWAIKCPENLVRFGYHLHPKNAVYFAAKCCQKAIHFKKSLLKYGRYKKFKMFSTSETWLTLHVCKTWCHMESWYSCYSQKSEFLYFGDFL